MSSECTTPPAPVACYGAGVCSGVGGSCSYPLKLGSKVCGAVCCNAIFGTCNANCTLTCNPGYADCDGDPSNGCETNLGAVGKKVCGAACIPVATCCMNSDCTMPPSPSSCYTTPGSCASPGSSCSYSVRSGSVVCSPAICCNAISGTCNANCTLNCAPGTGNCDGDPSNGCEHNTNNDPANCGGCANACALPRTTVDGCVGGNCTVVTCSGGYYDCNGIASDGCEAQGPMTGPGCCTGTTPTTSGTKMTQHNNGQGGTYFDCYPLGTPGTPSTFNVTMATDAANSDTTQTGSIIGSFTCGSGTSLVTSLCKSLDTNGATGTCTCWAYASGGAAGANAIVGHTYFNPGNNGCLCQATTDPSWN
jgi:hypothetical protein